MSRYINCIYIELNKLTNPGVEERCAGILT